MNIELDVYISSSMEMKKEEKSSEAKKISDVGKQTRLLPIDMPLHRQSLKRKLKEQITF